jgi:hypothetical protein
MALIVGAKTFDRLFAGVRFDEVDREILFVYAKDEGTAAKIEDEFALHSDYRHKHNGTRDQHRNGVATAARRLGGVGGSTMKTHRTVLEIFATALVIAVVAAFLTMLRYVDTRSASTEAAPGTIGLARPHPPLPPRTGQN